MTATIDYEMMLDWIVRAGADTPTATRLRTAGLALEFNPTSENERLWVEAYSLVPVVIRARAERMMATNFAQVERIEGGIDLHRT